MAFNGKSEPPYKRGKFEPEQGNLKNVGDPSQQLPDANARICSACGSSDHSEENCFYTVFPASSDSHIYTFQDDYDSDCSHNTTEDNESLASNLQQKEAPVETDKHATGEVNIHAIKNVIDDNSDPWQLYSTQYSKLLEYEGNRFLTVLKIKRNVTISVKKHYADYYVCILSGSTDAKNEAKAAISRFLMATDVGSFRRVKFVKKFTSVDAIKRNLNVLSHDRDWCSVANQVYHAIQRVTKEVHGLTTDNRFGRCVKQLRDMYSRLNAIIIGKHLIDEDKHHMDVLESDRKTYADDEPVRKFVNWCSYCSASTHFEADCYYNQPRASDSVHQYPMSSVENYGSASTNFEEDCFYDQPQPSNSGYECDTFPVSTTENYEEFHEPANDIPAKAVDTFDQSCFNISKDKDTWYVSSPDYHRLSGPDDQIFLTTLGEKMDLSIELKKETPDRYVCILKGGSVENKSDAVSALERYCAASEPFPFIPLRKYFTDMEVIETNLEWFDSDRDWWRRSYNFYTTILSKTNAIKGAKSDEVRKKLECDLKRMYAKFNSIIIVKLQIGQDKEHVNILKSGSHDKVTLTNSFNYVFNSERILYPNYKELIDKLPKMQGPTRQNNDDRHFAFESLKLSVLRWCRTMKWDDRTDNVNYLYSLVIIHNYAGSHVVAFKNEAFRLKRMSKVEKTKNDRAKNAARRFGNRKF